MTFHFKTTLKMLERQLPVGLFLVLLVITAGCTKPTGNGSGTIDIVTTSNIVADWVKNVGGDRVEVFALMPVGSDPHTFQPGAADVARIAKARVIFSVGLHLEGQWLSQLITNAAVDPNRNIALGQNIDPLPADPAHEEEGQYDPHFWWDPVRVKIAVDKITAELTSIDPSGENTYLSNAAAYKTQLDALNDRIAQKTGQVPPDNRKIVTSHETMQYFAQRYGFETIGSVFPGISTDREPTAAELAELVNNIKKLGISTIFTETSVSDRLSQSIAAETGIKVVRLYSDSLGPVGSEAESYIAMMDSDVEKIYQALK